MGIEIRSHKGPEKPIIDMPVELVNLADLIPHEQTIDHELQWFTDHVQESNAVFWPMLIDKGSRLILDGHHRHAGLLKLDYENAPAILIDYMDDVLVQLHTWYPKIDCCLDDVLAAFEEAGLKIIAKEDLKLNLRKLSAREITAIVGNNSNLFEIMGDRETIFRIMRDNWIEKIVYYDDIEQCLKDSGDSGTAVLGWSYTKQEILHHVKQGIVHLPKTTRHELKYEVPKCNMTLEDLRKK